MKRRLFKLVVFLLVGAVVNVAVAWGCALWSVGEDIYWMPSEIYENLPTATAQDERRINLLGWKTEVGTKVYWEELKAFGFSRRELYEIPDRWFGMFITSGVSAFASRTSCGWPLHSMRGDQLLDREKDELASSAEYFGDVYNYIDAIPIEIEVSRLGSLPRPLPLRPTWPGFAINTVVYAAILWSITLGPFTARRMIRRKRGRCIKCGYDLRGLSGGVCPECGLGREVVEAVRRN